MLYFKHSALAKQYHVSLRTVHNWIDETKQGKLDLTLVDAGGKLYVANTAKNISLLTSLVENRRKYRNTKAVKNIYPKPEFYDLYSEAQIYDIVTNLEIHHEIPRQYSYMDQGAEHWDTYAIRLATERTANILNSTVKLLSISQHYLDELLAKYKKINIIDIGAGNAYPVRGFLDHLIKQNKMGRYIALDVSPDMLGIAKRNIHEWFGDAVKFESRICDINYDRFSDLLIQEYANENARDTVNVTLLLGGTLSNMRHPDGAFRVIHDSMGINDIFIYTYKLDTQTTRNYFDFSTDPSQIRLADIHRFVVDLLNIDESYYTVELGYDPRLQQRTEHLRLNVSLKLIFKFKAGIREVELNKGSSILTWRSHQQTAADIHRQIERNDFYILNSTQTDDCEYILSVAKVKSD